MNRKIQPKKSVHGTIAVPGDKSISHRSVMFGSIANGLTEVKGFLDGEDCRSTISCFRKLGVAIEQSGDRVAIHGKGMRGLTKPQDILDVGNSGTTIRLISGILAAQNFDCEITGDASIQKRPMGRVILPLSEMGADIQGVREKNLAPLRIAGGRLTGITYDMPVASAQVKSALILAGLYAEGETRINEIGPTRDHTEIMLNYLGANIVTEGRTVISAQTAELHGRKIVVPGDISSAAYFIVAGLIMPDSEITLTNVGVNETRTGIITVLEGMGADIRIVNKRQACGEWVADIVVRSSRLRGTVLQGDVIPRMIDEIPVLAVAALFAEGETVIRDAQELKVKESNRIHTMAVELGKMGAVVEETDDGMRIAGGQRLRGAAVESYCDHRVAMSLAVAAIAAEGETEIAGAEIASVSFPDFYDCIEKI